MSVNFARPLTADLRADVLASIRAYMTAQARMFANETLTNTPTDAIRWNPAMAIFERWNGAAWTTLSHGTISAQTIQITQQVNRSLLGPNNTGIWLNFTDGFAYHDAQTGFVFRFGGMNQLELSGGGATFNRWINVGGPGREGGIRFLSTAVPTGFDVGLLNGDLGLQAYVWHRANGPVIIGTNNQHRATFEDRGGLTLTPASSGDTLTVQGSSSFHTGATFHANSTFVGALTALSTGTFAGALTAPNVVLGSATARRGVHQITDWNQTTHNDVCFLSSENATPNAPSTDFIYGMQMAFHRTPGQEWYRTQLVANLSGQTLWYRTRRDVAGWTPWMEILAGHNDTRLVRYAGSAQFTGSGSGDFIGAPGAEVGYVGGAYLQGYNRATGQYEPVRLLTGHGSTLWELRTANQGVFGQWQIEGLRNSYNGLRLQGVLVDGGTPVFMAGNARVGVYLDNVRWSWFDDGSWFFINRPLLTEGNHPYMRVTNAGSFSGGAVTIQQGGSPSGGNNGDIFLIW